MPALGRPAPGRPSFAAIQQCMRLAGITPARMVKVMPPSSSEKKALWMLAARACVAYTVGALGNTPKLPQL